MAGRKLSNLFYRIETSSQRGPYRFLNVAGYSFSGRHNLDNRPSPENDGILRKHWGRSDAQEYKFGFKTETQLKKWFPSAVIKTMAKRAGEDGVKLFVSIYRGECIAGERQAVAKLNRLELISRTELAKYAAGEKLIKKKKMESPPAPKPSMFFALKSRRGKRDILLTASNFS
jgi:hypothetical protein